jgi:hypothetical protein
MKQEPLAPQGAGPVPPTCGSAAVTVFSIGQPLCCRRSRCRFHYCHNRAFSSPRCPPRSLNQDSPEYACQHDSGQLPPRGSTGFCPSHRRVCPNDSLRRHRHRQTFARCRHFLLTDWKTQAPQRTLVLPFRWCGTGPVSILTRSCRLHGLDHTGCYCQRSRCHPTQRYLFKIGWAETPHSLLTGLWTFIHSPI